MRDFFFGDEEALVGAGAGFFVSQICKAYEDVGDVVCLGFLSFVVQCVAVGFHVVEPDAVGAAGACLGEDKDGCRYAGVGFEDARGHGDDGAEVLVFDEFFADGFVRV